MSLSRLKRADALIREMKAELKAQKTEIPEDPIKFCRDFLGFKPTKYQRKLIRQFQKKQFLAARWCRQSGKSHILAALILHYALTHPESYIGIVGPSWRQAKLIVDKKINAFLRKLPRGLYQKPQRTIVRLRNGSIIETFPNSPETIRGPTLQIVMADEFNFIPNDVELYDAIMFTLATTAGKFICTSTPGSTDSMFYKIFHDKAYKDFAKSHITWQDAVAPKGPLKKRWLNKIKRQLEGDPCRWQREMMAEWAEDENVWLPLALITSCIDHELEFYDFDDLAKGQFYAGLDLGKYQDFSVLEVMQLKDDIVSLVHERRFPLKTAYASVIGYVKTLSDRWGFRKVLVDMSGVGDYIVEDMISGGIKETEGVKFTQQSKEELATYLKQTMVQKKFKLPYQSDLIAELNIERFELTKSGAIRFSHPDSTHDDRFWALALGVYASRTPRKAPHDAFIFH